LLKAYKYYQLKDEAKAQKVVDKAKELCTGRPGIYYFKLARFCFRAGGIYNDETILSKIRDYTGVDNEEEYLKKAIEETPDYLPSFTPYKRLYYIYKYSGRKDDLMKLLLKLVNVDKENPEIYLLLGGEYVKSNKEKAIEYFALGEKIAKEGSRHYLNSRWCADSLAKYYLDAGKHDEATSLLEKHKRYGRLMEINFKSGDLDKVYHFFEAWLNYEYEHNKSRMSLFQHNVYGKTSIEKIVDRVKHDKRLKDLSVYRQYVEWAYFLEREQHFIDTQKIYEAILERYADVPPTKRKPSKGNYFREWLPIIITVLKIRIEVLQKGNKEAVESIN
jgi:tetratricopeptide (TPR) repeat protein